MTCRIEQENIRLKAENDTLRKENADLKDRICDMMAACKEDIKKPTTSS